MKLIYRFKIFNFFFIQNQLTENQLYSPEDVCIEIISLKIHYVETQGELPTALSALIPELKFPQFQGNEIKAISREIQSGENYCNVLVNHNFELQFYKEYLFLVSEHINNIQAQIPLIASTVLYMYLAWCIEHNKSNSLKALSTLTKSLMQMSQVKNIQLQKLLVSAFHNLILIYLNDEQFNVPIRVLKYIRRFYSHNFLLTIDSFDLLTEVLEIALKSENNYEELLIYIGILCEELKDFFPNQAAENIISNLMFQLSRLDVPPLSLFSHLSQHLQSETNIKIFSIFGNSILHYISNFEPTINFSQSYENSDPDSFIPSVEVSLKFWDKPGFVNGLKLNQNISFPEQVSTNKLLNDNVANRLFLIVSATNGHKELITLLLDSFSSIIFMLKDKKYLCDLKMIFLYMCSHFSKYLRPSDADILLSAPFFHQSLTIYEQNDDFLIVNTIRSLIIQTLLKSSSSFLNQIISKWINYPLLYAEVIQRIILNLQGITLSNEDISQFCKMLMLSSLHYQHLHYQVDQENVENIEITRTSILLLISSLFSSQENMLLYFSNNFFDTFFFSFVFEEQLRNFVLTHLLSFLSKQQKDIPELLIQMLQQIITISFDSFPDDRYVNLIIDILTTLNDALLHQRSITSYFEPMISPLFKSFSFVKNDQGMQKYLLQCLQFLSIVAKPKHILTSQYDNMDKAIVTCFGDSEIPQNLVNKIIQVIAGDNLSSLVPQFYIMHPKAVRVLLHVLSNDPKLLNMINFINSLVAYSNFNAKQLRSANFDLFLIKEIKNQNNENILNAFLDLFQQIATVVSCVSVVQSYISLLSPIDGKYYPEFQQNYIKTMSQIVRASSNEPYASIPMINKESPIEIFGLNQTDIENGFTFVFWILLDHSPSQYKPMPLFLQDSKGNTINIFISSVSLYCELKTTKMSSTGKVENLIPTNQWAFIAITFDHEPDRTFMTPTFNVRQIKHLEYFHMPFQPGPITCKIGGITYDSTKSDSISKIATFGLFHRINQDSITYLFQMGPRGIGNLPEAPIFYYTTEEENGLLNVKERYSLSTIKCNVNDSSLPPEANFTKILTNFCKSQALLPLFAQIDMTTINGKSFPIEKLTIELFGNLLSTSVPVQESFFTANGVEIISHLLSVCDDIYIDYALYLQFYSSIQGITYFPLQIKMLNLILLDTELWLRADSESHIRILKHWDRTLFPSMMSYLISTFHSIILIMRVYYWYSETNEEKEYTRCQTRCRGQSLNIAECRQLLSRIAIKIAMEKFDKEDFICLESHCLTCSETQQVVDLLRIVKIIGSSDPSPLSSLNDEKGNIDLISFLYSLLAKRNDDLLILIFETIIAFYRNKLIIKPSLQDQMLYIMEQLSPSRISDQLFKLAQNSVLNGYHEMFQFCFWMTSNGNISEECVLELIVDITPCRLFNTHVNWSFWPIVYCYNSKNLEIRRKVLNFLASCDCDIWTTHFIMIHDVGIILKEKSEDIKSEYLQCISEIILMNLDIDINKIISFFIMMRRFILYRSKKEDSKALIRLFKQSPFYDKSLERPSDLAPSVSEFISSAKSMASGFPLPKKSKNNSGSTSMNYGSTDFFPSSVDSIDYVRNQDDIVYISPVKHRRPYGIGSLTVRPRIFSSSPIMSSPDDDYQSSQQHLLETPSKIKKKKTLKEKIEDSQFDNDVPQFSLRFDDNGNWADACLAEKCIEIFQRYQIFQFLHFDLILCSFLMHVSPENVIDHIHQIDIISFINGDENSISSASSSLTQQPQIPHQSKNSTNDIQPFIDLLNHHCETVGYDFIVDPLPENDLLMNAFKCLQKCNFSNENDLIASAKQLLSIIKLEILDSSQHVANTLDFFFDEIVSENREQILKEIEKLNQSKDLYSHYWIKLWRSLAIDPAPWSSNLNLHAHFMRDQSVCSYFCPCKMKRNWNFDDHKIAATARDTPSSVTAQILINQEILARKKEIAFPTQLLEISPVVINENFSIDDSTSISKSIIRSNSLTTLQSSDSIMIDTSSSMFTVPCAIIEINRRRPSQFVLFGNRIEIITSTGKIIQILHSEIIHILFRTVCHIPNSLEIFLDNGKSYFIHFPQHQSLPIIRNISSLSLPRVKLVQTTGFFNFFNQKGKTQLWVHKKISNFEYLMNLNILSGRSFNNIAQYPIFPWVIKDYSSKTLDFSNPVIYRDLNKPVGAFNPERLKNLIAKLQNGSGYLYNSAPSNINSVCFYLVRLEPFTSIHINFQNGKFDHPSRLFKSIEELFSSVNNASNDFKELIPEFYYDFEFLKNSNNFDLGNNENGSINDVVLPPWANGSRFEFVYMMRKALESDFVSYNLHNWIDLIWGYKQSGEYANSSFNVYMKEMYETIWNDANNTLDSTLYNQIKSVLEHCGQIPSQLMKTPHPSRRVNEKIDCPFPSSYTIPTNKIKNVILSNIEYVGDWHLKIFLIDISGVVIIQSIDLSSKRNKTEQRRSIPSSFIAPARSFSSHLTRSLSPKPEILLTQSAEPETRGREEDISKNIQINTNNKEIKGLSDIKFNLFDKPNSTCNFESSKIFFTSAVANELYMIDTTKLMIENMEMKGVLGIASRGQYIAVSKTDAILEIYKGGLQNQSIHSFPSFGDLICCCAITNKFYMVIIGTKNGTLILNSLNSFNIVRVIDLKGARPLNILVTDSWGFIVCHASKIKGSQVKYYIFVFSVNGELIRKTKINFRICSWCSWSTGSGFDFMAITDNLGKIFSFEVFYCDIKEKIHNCSSKVISIDYISDINCLVCVTEDAKIIFLPCIANS